MIEDRPDRIIAGCHATGVRYIEGGKVTPRFGARAQKVLAKYDKAFEQLAK